MPTGGAAFEGYSANKLANEFIKAARLKGNKLTHLQIQKLVYIAHGFNLALNQAPLTYHDIYAWPYGHVFPVLYEELKSNGSKLIDKLLAEPDELIGLSDEERAVIEGVYEAYGQLSGSRLVGLTHSAETPWSKTWEFSQYSEIPDDLIRSHYEDLINTRYAEAQ